MSLRSSSMVVLLLVALGCSKDTYESRPNLKIKKVNPTEVRNGEPFTITLEYTDKEGDLAGVPITIKKIVGDCALSQFTDSISFTIPGDLPATNNQKGELQITLPYTSNAAKCTPRADTAVFSLWVKDKGGHISDTVTTEKIVIH